MTLRRPLGVLGIFLFICVYALVVVWLAAPVVTLHPLLQAPIWLVLGIAWIFPLRPVLRWIETGQMRPPQ